MTCSEYGFPDSRWPRLGWRCRIRRHKAVRLPAMGGIIGPVTLWTCCETCGVIGSDRSREIGEGTLEYQQAVRDAG